MGGLNGIDSEKFAGFLKNIPIPEQSPTISDELSSNLKNLTKEEIPNLSNLIENLELNSVIIPEHKNLDSLGCRIRIEKNALVIETRSTDEMVKMSVYFMRKSILILDPGRDYVNRTVIVIKLLPAISENIELFTTLAFPGNDYGGWINYDCKDSPRIDDSEKIEIMKFFNPPLEWIKPKLMSHL